jgi:hypothetical protein
VYPYLFYEWRRRQVQTTRTPAGACRWRSALGGNQVAIWCGQQRHLPILSQRIAGRFPGQPAIISSNGSLLGLENWKRSTRWRSVIGEIGRPTLRVHDLRHTYASLARRAGADCAYAEDDGSYVDHGDAHIYADLYYDELDDVASALDALDDCARTFRNRPPDRIRRLAGYWPIDFSWASLTTG